MKQGTETKYKIFKKGIIVCYYYVLL